jgi:hypothetical protein
MYKILRVSNTRLKDKRIGRKETRRKEKIGNKVEKEKKGSINK